jgi:hypothetical protein
VHARECLAGDGAGLLRALVRRLEIQALALPLAA